MFGESGRRESNPRSQLGEPTGCPHRDLHRTGKVLLEGYPHRFVVFAVVPYLSLRGARNGAKLGQGRAGAGRDWMFSATKLEMHRSAASIRKI